MPVDKTYTQIYDTENSRYIDVRCKRGVRILRGMINSLYGGMKRGRDDREQDDASLLVSEIIRRRTNLNKIMEATISLFQPTTGFHNAKILGVIQYGFWMGEAKVLTAFGNVTRRSDGTCELGVNQPKSPPEEIGWDQLTTYDFIDVRREQLATLYKALREAGIPQAAALKDKIVVASSAWWHSSENENIPEDLLNSLRRRYGKARRGEETLLDHQYYRQWPLSLGDELSSAFLRLQFVPLKAQPPLNLQQIFMKESKYLAGEEGKWLSNVKAKWKTSRSVPSSYKDFFLTGFQSRPFTLKVCAHVRELLTNAEVSNLDEFKEGSTMMLRLGRQAEARPPKRSPKRGRGADRGSGEDDDGQRTPTTMFGGSDTRVHCERVSDKHSTSVCRELFNSRVQPRLLRELNNWNIRHQKELEEGVGGEYYTQIFGPADEGNRAFDPAVTRASADTASADTATEDKRFPSWQILNRIYYDVIRRVTAALGGEDDVVVGLERGVGDRGEAKAKKAKESQPPTAHSPSPTKPLGTESVEQAMSSLLKSSDTLWKSAENLGAFSGTGGKKHSDKLGRLLNINSQIIINLLEGRWPLPREKPLSSGTVWRTAGMKAFNDKMKDVFGPQTPSVVLSMSVIYCLRELILEMEPMSPEEGEIKDSIVATLKTLYSMSKITFNDFFLLPINFYLLSPEMAKSEVEDTPIVSDILGYLNKNWDGKKSVAAAYRKVFDTQVEALKNQFTYSVQKITGQDKSYIHTFWSMTEDSAELWMAVYEKYHTRVFGEYNAAVSAQMRLVDDLLDPGAAAEKNMLIKMMYWLLSPSGRPVQPFVFGPREEGRGGGKKVHQQMGGAVIVFPKGSDGLTPVEDTVGGWKELCRNVFLNLVAFPTLDAAHDYIDNERNPVALIRDFMKVTNDYTCNMDNGGGFHIWGGAGDSVITLVKGTERGKRQKKEIYRQLLTLSVANAARTLGDKIPDRGNPTLRVVKLNAITNLATLLQLQLKKRTSNYSMSLAINQNPENNTVIALIYLFCHPIDATSTLYPDMRSKAKEWLLKELVREDWRTNTKKIIQLPDGDGLNIIPVDSSQTFFLSELLKDLKMITDRDSWIFCITDVWLGKNIETPYSRQCIKMIIPGRMDGNLGFSCLTKESVRRGGRCKENYLTVVGKYATMAPNLQWVSDEGGAGSGEKMPILKFGYEKDCVKKFKLEDNGVTYYIELIEGENELYHYQCVDAGGGHVVPDEVKKTFLRFLYLFRLTTMEKWLHNSELVKTADTPIWDTPGNWIAKGKKYRPPIRPYPLSPYYINSGDIIMPFYSKCEWDESSSDWLIYITFNFAYGADLLWETKEIVLNTNMVTVKTLSKLMDCIINSYRLNNYTNVEKVLFPKDADKKDLTKYMDAFRGVYKSLLKRSGVNVPHLNLSWTVYCLYLAKCLKFVGDSSTTAWNYIYNVFTQAFPIKISVVQEEDDTYKPLPISFLINGDRIAGINALSCGAMVTSTTPWTNKPMLLISYCHDELKTSLEDRVASAETDTLVLLGDLPSSFAVNVATAKSLGLEKEANEYSWTQTNDTDADRRKRLKDCMDIKEKINKYNRDIKAQREKDDVRQQTAEHVLMSIENSAPKSAASTRPHDLIRQGRANSRAGLSWKLSTDATKALKRFWLFHLRSSEIVGSVKKDHWGSFFYTTPPELLFGGGGELHPEPHWSSTEQSLQLGGASEESVREQGILMLHILKILAAVESFFEWVFEPLKYQYGANDNNLIPFKANAVRELYNSLRKQYFDGPSSIVRDDGDDAKGEGEVDMADVTNDQKAIVNLPLLVHKGSPEEESRSLILLAKNNAYRVISPNFSDWSESSPNPVALAKWTQFWFSDEPREGLPIYLSSEDFIEEMLQLFPDGLLDGDDAARVAIKKGLDDGMILRGTTMFIADVVGGEAKGSIGLSGLADGKFTKEIREYLTEVVEKSIDAVKKYAGNSTSWSELIQTLQTLQTLPGGEEVKLVTLLKPVLAFLPPITQDSSAEMETDSDS